jgi:aspartate/methionine/tyrosine aminotransferase
MQNPVRPSAGVRQLESTLRDLAALAQRLKPRFDAEGEPMYFFNLGDPNKFDFDTPQYMKDVLIHAVTAGGGFYSPSQGDPELIAAIVDHENATKRLALTADDVVITAGVSEGIHFIFEALCDPGDEVLLPGPSYPPYIQNIRLTGAHPIPYRTVEDDGWKPDLDDLRRRITEKTRAISVVNPNNPTGAVYAPSILRQIIDVAAVHGLPLITDEIYGDMVYGPTDYAGLASLATDSPVIGLNGFSKIYLAPGWRCGYLYFHDPTEVLGDLRSAVIQLARNRLSACTPIMKACAVAFTGPQDHVRETNRKLKARAEYAANRLNEIEGITTQQPEGAFYIFPAVDLRGRWKTDRDFSVDALHHTGLVLPHGSGFCPTYGRGHFRSVILPPIETMEAAFGKLDAFMRRG